MRQFRDCGLKFHTVVNNDNVKVIQNHKDVILEGQWMDVDLAVNNIKDALAKSLCGALDRWSRVNESTTSAPGSNLEQLDQKLDRDVARYDLQTHVTVDIDRRQTTATGKHQHVNSSHHVTASASPDMHESQIEIDEHIWHYIAFCYAEMYEHWKRTFSLRLNRSSQMIEITGKLQDVIDINEWFKKHDLISVKLRVIEIPPSIDVNALKALVNSGKAAEFRVRVRLVPSTIMECIGKTSDINNFISWLDDTLHNITEHKNTGSSTYLDNSAQGESNTVGNVSSHVSSTVADAVTCKKPIIVHADQGRLKFKTAESQLEVEVLKGDLTTHKSNAIVNPANKYLLHSGGAAKAIQNAAGSSLICECYDYIRKHKELPTSSVMHTTSGKLPRPINYVIHACGPNARDHPDDKQCLQLLEKTFLNCFVYANDTLHVQSLALPAISSGITIVLHII